MPKELVISAAPHETRVAILEDGQLCEIYIEREKEFALVGSIYKGRVTRVLPGMQSAFVDIGLDSDAFLYVGDFLENLEDYDHVVTAVEGKVEKMEQQGGVIFAPTPTAAATGGEGASTGEPLAEPWLGSGSQAESTDAAPESAPQPQHNEPGASHLTDPAASHVAPPAPAITPPATSPSPASPFIRQDRPSGPPSHYRDNRQDYRQGPPAGQGPREGQGRDQVKVAIRAAIGAVASVGDVFAGVAGLIAARDVICLPPNMHLPVLLRLRDPTSHPHRKSLPAITPPSFFPANRSQNTRIAFQELLRSRRPQRIG